MTKNITVQFGDEVPVNCTTILGVGAYTIPNGTAAGNYYLSLTFSGDDKYAPSSFETMIEVYKAQTVITAMGPSSIPRPLVIEDLGYYPLLLYANTTVPLPLANRTVMVQFNHGRYEIYQANEYGIINYKLPDTTEADEYFFAVEYDGEYDYKPLTYGTWIKVYDVETQIIAAENVTYDRPSVIDGDAVYPIYLAVPTVIGNVTVPLPLGNKTVWIAFDDKPYENITTDILGMIYYAIPEDTEDGTHNISMFFIEDGYVYSKFNATVEVYDVDTQIISLGNASYPRPLVINELGYYPIMLATNVTLI